MYNFPPTTTQLRDQINWPNQWSTSRSFIMWIIWSMWPICIIRVWLIWIFHHKHRLLVSGYFIWSVWIMGSIWKMIAMGSTRSIWIKCSMITMLHDHHVWQQYHESHEYHVQHDFYVKLVKYVKHVHRSIWSIISLVFEACYVLIA